MLVQTLFIYLSAFSNDRCCCPKRLISDRDCDRDRDLDVLIAGQRLLENRGANYRKEKDGLFVTHCCDSEMKTYTRVKSRRLYMTSKDERHQKRSTGILSVQKQFLW